MATGAMNSEASHPRGLLCSFDWAKLALVSDRGTYWSLLRRSPPTTGPGAPVHRSQVKPRVVQSAAAC